MISRIGKRFRKNIPDIVFYHNNCPDGLCAAYAFWKVYPDIKYIGVTHGLSHPKNVHNKNVYMLDFSYKRDILKELCNKAKNVMIIDHHKSFIEDVNNLESECQNFAYIFNEDKCGAELSWEYMFPNTEVPWFIKYIGDRDLWKWELPYSKEINRALYFLGYTFYDYENKTPPWKKLEQLLNEKPFQIQKKLIERGKYILEQEEQEVKIACSNSIRCNFEDCVVRLTTCSPHLRSEVGNKIAETYTDCDFVAVWRYDFSNDHWYISLRNRNPEKDLTPYAEKYGGGGHSHACGFTIYGGLSPEIDTKEKLTPPAEYARGNLQNYFRKID